MAVRGGIGINNLVWVEDDLHATPLVLFKESENGERCKRV
jgi:hypothetical protein